MKGSEIATAIDGFALHPLTIDDLDAYATLVDANRRHLTAHGDFTEFETATLGDLEADLMADASTRFAAWLDDVMIGRVDLVPRGGGNVVLGYWLDAGHTGHGYATQACRALLTYGRDTLGATDVWAGVTKGNVRSELVLARLGFERVADMGSYTRFHRALR
ncbi:MAG: GNAT family N-acetyltransferase [Actinomycetota bacterium]